MAVVSGNSLSAPLPFTRTRSCNWGELISGEDSGFARLSPAFACRCVYRWTQPHRYRRGDVIITCIPQCHRQVPKNSGLAVAGMPLVGCGPEFAGNVSRGWAVSNRHIFSHLITV